MNLNAPTQTEVKNECRKYLKYLNNYAKSGYDSFKENFTKFEAQKERLTGVLRAAYLTLDGSEKEDLLKEAADFYCKVGSLCVEYIYDQVNISGQPTLIKADTLRRVHKEVNGKAKGITDASNKLSKDEQDTLIGKLLGDNDSLTNDLQEINKEFDDLKCNHEKVLRENIENNKKLETIQQNLAITNEEFKLLCKKTHAILGTKQAKQARYMFEIEGRSPEEIADIMEVSLETILKVLRYKTY